MQMIDIEQLPGCASASPIRVGGVVIDENAIAREMQYHSADSVSSAQRKAAKALVIRELLHQRAVAIGLTDASDGRGDQDDPHVAALLERELVIPEPTEEDCRRFHRAFAERFSQPTRVKVCHVLLASAPDDAERRDADYRRGMDLIQQLKGAPERFTEFAQRYSDCPSSDAGGDLGWLIKGQTVPELDRALQHLPEGLHDYPLASRYGWHLIRVDARIAGAELAFEQVAERVRHSLCEQTTRRALRHYLLALESETGVEGIVLDDDAGDSLMQ